MKRAWLFPLALLLTAAHCDSHTTEADVVYLGKGSDEAFLVLADAEARVMIDDAKAPVLTAPAEAALLPAATPPTFTWTAGFVASAPRPHRRRTLPALPAAGAPWGEAIARAHLPPITGPVFLLKFQGAAGEPLYVLTTEPSFTPEAAVWAKLAALGGAITVEMTGAYLRNNVLEEGPYRARTPRHFTITGVDSP